MKTILYTGARSGIAKNVIDNLKNLDYQIYVSVHTNSQLKEIKNIYKNNSNIKCLKLDITNEQDLKQIDKIDIDILVNHAATGEGGSILDIPFDKVIKNYETNVFASFSLIQRIAKKMIEKKEGRIVIMSSLASMMPIPFIGVYCSTKASISILTRTLQKELKLINNPIKIVLIEPGIYNTGFNEVMLENKYPWFNNSYFKNKKETIRKKERIMFTLLGKNNYNSIVKKIVKAITKDNPKKVYRAPLLQVIGAKIASLFN